MEASGRLANKRRNFGGNWETTSGKAHPRDILETTGTQLGDKRKTIGRICPTTRRQLGDKWKTSGRPLEDTFKTTGKNWKLWETTGKPLGDKVPIPRTLPKETKIGRHTKRDKGTRWGTN